MPVPKSKIASHVLNGLERCVSVVLRARLLLWSALLSMALQAAALAQAPPSGDAVSWTASVHSADNIKPGSRVTLELRGAVVDGWHVYGLEQLPRGPIPLRVALDPTEIAVADGEPAASPPVKTHDRAFGFDTQYYAEDFTVTAPVRIGSDVAPGPQQIPVSVRFQTCTGQTCRPPKTLHLSVPINVRKAG